MFYLIWTSDNRSHVNVWVGSWAGVVAIVGFAAGSECRLGVDGRAGSPPVVHELRVLVGKADHVGESGAVHAQ